MARRNENNLAEQPPSRDTTAPTAIPADPFDEIQRRHEAAQKKAAAERQTLNEATALANRRDKAFALLESTITDFNEACSDKYWAGMPPPSADGIGATIHARMLAWLEVTGPRAVSDSLDAGALCNRFATANSSYSEGERLTTCEFAIHLYRLALGRTIRQADIERHCTPEYNAAVFNWFLVLCRHHPDSDAATDSSVVKEPMPINSPPGYEIDESKRLIRRKHDGKYLDFGNAGGQWEIFHLAWKAWPEQYNLSDLEGEGNRNSKNRGVQTDTLKTKLRRIGLELFKRRLKTV